MTEDETFMAIALGGRGAAGRVRPNLKYDHVFVIIRVDTFQDIGADPETAVTATRAFPTKEAAEAEVQRLDRLNEDKGCVYFWLVARLEREA